MALFKKHKYKVKKAFFFGEFEDNTDFQQIGCLSLRVKLLKHLR